MFNDFLRPFKLVNFLQPYIWKTAGRAAKQTKFGTHWQVLSVYRVFLSARCQEEINLRSFGAFPIFANIAFRERLAIGQKDQSLDVGSTYVAYSG